MTTLSPDDVLHYAKTTYDGFILSLSNWADNLKPVENVEDRQSAENVIAEADGVEQAWQSIRVAEDDLGDCVSFFYGAVSKFNDRLGHWRVEQSKKPPYADAARVPADLYSGHENPLLGSELGGASSSHQSDISTFGQPAWMQSPFSNDVPVNNSYAPFSTANTSTQDGLYPRAPHRRSGNSTSFSTASFDSLPLMINTYNPPQPLFANSASGTFFSKSSFYRTKIGEARSHQLQLGAHARSSASIQARRYTFVGSRL